MSLENTPIVESDFFKALPNCSSLVFKGEGKNKVLLFEAICDGAVNLVFLLSVVSKSDRIFFDSILEMIKNGFACVMSRLRGTFTFELITVNIFQGIEYFDSNDFAQVILNKAKKMGNSEQVVIKYGSLYALFTKRTSQNWGKIIFSSFIKTYSKESTKLDLEFKSILKQVSVLTKSIQFIIIQDISRNAIFSVENEEQQSRISMLVNKSQTCSMNSNIIMKMIMRNHVVEF